MNEELKPCPFCGDMVHYEPYLSEGADYIIQCSNCGLSMFDDMVERLVRTWNTRPAPSVESVEEWEKRTGRKYPENGPVWATYEDSEDEDFALIRFNDGLRDPYFKVYVASPDHTKPEE